MPRKKKSMKVTNYKMYFGPCIMMYITSPLFKTRINRVAVKANNTEKEKRIVITILKERKCLQKKEGKIEVKYRTMRKRINFFFSLLVLLYLLKQKFNNTLTCTGKSNFLFIFIVEILSN